MACVTCRRREGRSQGSDLTLSPWLCCSEYRLRIGLLHGTLTRGPWALGPWTRSRVCGEVKRPPSSLQAQATVRTGRPPVAGLVSTLSVSPVRRRRCPGCGKLSGGRLELTGAQTGSRAATGWAQTDGLLAAPSLTSGFCVHVRLSHGLSSLTLCRHQAPKGTQEENLTWPADPGAPFPVQPAGQGPGQGGDVTWAHLSGRKKGFQKGPGRELGPQPGEAGCTLERDPVYSAVPGQRHPCLVRERLRKAYGLLFWVMGSLFSS